MHEDTHPKALDNRRPCACASQPEDGRQPPQSCCSSSHRHNHAATAGATRGPAHTADGAPAPSARFTCAAEKSSWPQSGLTPKTFYEGRASIQALLSNGPRRQSALPSMLTHEGPFGSMKPTGRKMSLPFCEILHFEKKGMVSGGCKIGAPTSRTARFRRSSSR